MHQRSLGNCTAGYFTLFDRISVEPAHERGDIEAVAIIVKARPGIERLRREAVAEDVGERTRLCDCTAEGVVGVGHDRLGVRDCRELSVGAVGESLRTARLMENVSSVSLTRQFVVNYTNFWSLANSFWRAIFYHQK